MTGRAIAAAAAAVLGVGAGPSCDAPTTADPADTDSTEPDTDTTEPDTDAAVDPSDDDCSLNPMDPERFVIVGFWATDDCSGDPIATNAFPVTDDGSCYCWPGHSGENSADDFSCDATAGTFTYTQYGSLTCGEDDPTPTVKTVSVDACHQDIPPTLYTRIVDMGPCAR